MWRGLRLPAWLSLLDRLDLAIPVYLTPFRREKQGLQLANLLFDPVAVGAQIDSFWPPGTKK